MSESSKKTMSRKAAGGRAEIRREKLSAALKSNLYKRKMRTRAEKSTSPKK